MKYVGTARTIKVGDHVRYAGIPGVIVFIIDDDCYSQKYSKNRWSYLGKGLGVELYDATGTLYHLNSPDEDLEFLSSE
jgi:hypothetical protein